MAAMSPAAIESLAGEILASASLGPHAVFSLRADAGRDAFKARYRELARALHPDKARSRAAEEAFKVVTESFRAVAAANDAGGGGCAGARTDDARDSTSKAPFWRVRGEDAAAAPPRWSAGAGAREKEHTPAAPRWSAAARGAASADPRARAFEKSSRGGWRPSNANAHGGRREASPSPETVRLDETLVDEKALEDDIGGSFDPDPSPTEPPAWFDLDRREDARDALRKNENATARWNDSATHSGRVFFRSGSAASSRARTGEFTVAEEDPYDEILEADPERDDVEDASTSFGGEKVWAHTSRETLRGGTGGGWGGASEKQKREKASLKTSLKTSQRRDAWRGGWSDATDRYAAAGDFRGFDVADVGDPSELERLACEGNETNERFGVVDGNDENRSDDAARARARTKQKQNARDEDASSGAAGPSRAGGGAEAGKTNPSAGARKRARSKKAAGAVPAAPRPRLAALDEPRIPHTKLPRKKFAQATLAFS